MRANGLALGLLLVSACAHPVERSPPAPAPAAVTSPASAAMSAPSAKGPPSTPTRSERARERERLREPAPRALRELPRVLPVVAGSKPPVSCNRISAGPLIGSRTTCGDSMAARLAGALELSAVEPRDRALAQLEPCNELPDGWVRAVRAEVARECADALIAPALRALKAPLDADLGETLLALALAARWGRAVGPPVAYSGDGGEESVAQYLARVLRPWKQRQLARIEALSSAPWRLERNGYGAAIVALARARATHQLYGFARSSPIPTELKRNYVLRTRYFSALEGELSDVRARMGAEHARASELLFEQGVHRAPDADAWFQLQRHDFANLVVEPPTAVKPSSDTERIIRSLPSFYVEGLFGTTPLDDPRQLRLLIEHGLTPRQRSALATHTLATEKNRNFRLLPRHVGNSDAAPGPLRRSRGRAGAGSTTFAGS